MAYSSKQITLLNTINDFIIQKGYSIVRMGNVEGVYLLGKEENNQLRNNAGFYGDGDDLKFWRNAYMKALFNSNVIMNVISCDSFKITRDLLTYFNIWKPQIPYLEYPTFYLEIIQELHKQNKKICIVSYFADEMKNQLEFINEIWGNKFKINPALFEFVETYNTISGNTPHSGFTETYNEIVKKLDKSESNYYFLSCGCYGLPLCDYLKNKGHNSLYVGGLLQILFGLMGKRWETRQEVLQFFNIYWKYPQKRPKNSVGVEGGCYW